MKDMSQLFDRASVMLDYFVTNKGSFQLGLTTCLVLVPNQPYFSNISFKEK